MANPVRGEPPAGSPAESISKPSSGPPPAPKRHTEDRLASASDAPPAASNDRRAEYVPAAPRATPDFPKIPKLDLPNAVQTASVAPRAVDASAPAPRSSSVPPPSPGPREARTMPPAGHVSTQPSQRSAGVITRLGDSLRARLPVGLKERIEGVPSVGLIVGAGALAVLVVVAAGLTARTAYRAVSGSSVPGTAEKSLAESADTSGPAAASPTGSEPTVEQRTNVSKSSEDGQSTPRDEATVLLDLANQLLSQRRDADAPPLVARVIAREPARTNDPRVGQILIATASSDDRRAVADSYALLTGPMGEAGAVLVYELSVKRGVRDGIRARAQTWLGSKEFEKIAPLPVFAAQKLRAAKTCEDKHALLDFAERAGGKHVLEYLKEVEKKKACAPDDLEHCYPCMRNDSKLSDVIASLERKG